MKRSCYALLFFGLLLAQSKASFAQSADVIAKSKQTWEFAVPVSAVVSENPAKIRLQWPVDPKATSYRVSKKAKGAEYWGQAATLTAKDSFYEDKSVQLGTSYEYQVTKVATINGKSVTCAGYCNAGIKAPLPQRGKVILFVDNTFSVDLATEIKRLETDLTADGWAVIRYDVSRTAKPTEVKNLVIKEYNSGQSNLEAVFLLGHVPVQYSGNINPDGHPDHKGAWPADVYYGDAYNDGWTDDEVNTDNNGANKPSRDETRNIPGDGKFDQSFIPNEIELMVGRVDLSGMGAFNKSEKELLKQYLDKDHAFRTGTLTAPTRALINDNFGAFYDAGEAFGSSGWRNFSALVGYENTRVLDWFGTLDTAAYLWAYGCGAGSYTSISGIGNTTDFANHTPKAIFNMLFGSYLGDWNITNNVLRAPLATAYGLTSCWSGRPYWHFYHMALGEPIGYSARMTQNNDNSYDNGFYRIGAQYVHVALMGDPTLRMHYTVSPSNLSLTVQQEQSITLKWQAPAKAPLGYNIYRSQGASKVFVKISATPVAATEFIDVAPFADTNLYLVRAVTLEQTPSGTYYNESPGASAVVSGFTPSLGVTESVAQPNQLLVAQEEGAIRLTLRQYKASQVSVGVYDITGRELAKIVDGTLQPGVYNYTWDKKTASGMRASSGLYFIRTIEDGKIQTHKFMITR